MTLRTVVVQAAVLGPAATGLAWVLLNRLRWPRRIACGILALASLAAAWWVFWLVYEGQGPTWAGVAPDLLGATVAAVAEVGILFGVVDLERHRPDDRLLLGVGMAASASAIVLAAYTHSLVVLAAVTPLPTLATAVVCLGGDRPDRRGLIGLAVADVLVLAGLTVILDRTGTTVLTASPGLGAAFVLAGAAAKAGAIPGVATARLTSAVGTAAAMAGVLRGQAVALAAAGGLVVAGAEQMAPLAVAAAVAGVASGVVAIAGSTRGAIVAGVIGVGAATLFVALGLGGGVGARAFLLLFPPFLLAAAAAPALWLGVDRLPRGRLHRIAWVGGILAGGVLAGSLVGLPAGGGFPGTWLTVSLAGGRAADNPWYLLLEGGALLALALALMGAVGLLRAVRSRPAGLVAAMLSAVALLYLGIQPVRLGVGWWLRIEEALKLPEVLPSAGGPLLPPIGGLDLVLALVPAVALVGVVLAAGRGVRRSHPAFVTVFAPRATPGWTRRGASGRLRARATPDRRARWSLIVVAVLELGAVVLAVRLLVLGIRAGFL